MTTRSLVFAAALACAVGLAAQDPATTPVRELQDDGLLDLEAVVAMLADRLAPSLVRIETFGGTRRVLADDGGGDRIGSVEPSKLDKEVLAALFAKLDPFELAELWTGLGLPPKPEGTAFEAEDLRLLGDKELDRLCRKYQVGSYDPEKVKEAKEKKGLGPLVQPGFLQAQGASTGIVLSSDGWILTSRFALNFDPSTILVTLPDGRAFTARRAGEDTSRGIALIKIEATDLPVPTLAAPDEVAVGQWAFVLGRTFAASGRPTIHMGIVSAAGRIFGRALQIDANTSPANYGGPVVDALGRVLGLAVPLSPSGRNAGLDWHDSGIGFATTLADIGPLLERLKRGETLHRAWLGVAVDPAFMGPGAKLAGLAPRSPAARLGWLRGDLIAAVDGVPVRNSFHLQTLIGSRLAGETVQITTRRGDGEPQSIAVTLAAVPAAEREEQTRSEESAQLPWDGDPAPKPDEPGKR
ncbi:MAG: trypsin-like peptidase domain-containing protein [Planctomycetes bacterium]|nr:trypsin-like peptidase domain-containing protein [Planctomycetota bacterium]